MENSAYRILGISEQNLADGRKPEDIDFDIKMKFKRKLDELLEQINQILLKKDTTAYEKISKVNAKTQEMFAYTFSYMKIMTQQNREGYKTGTTPTVEEDMRNMQENLRKMTKVEHRKGKDGTRIPCNAYQVLGIPDGQNGITDKKIEIKTLTLLNMTVSKTPPDELEEITDMLFSVQRGMWAYSKLNTQENRRNYQKEINCQRLSQDSRRRESEVGAVRREQRKKFITRPLVQTDEGDTIVSLTEIGRLVNRDILLDVDVLTQYLVEKNVGGEKTRNLVFSKNLDMERIHTDDSYAEIIRKMLSDDNIALSRKYLGGYVGEIREESMQIDGHQEEVLRTWYNTKNIAICKKFQREEKIRRESRNSENPLPPNGDAR